MSSTTVVPSSLAALASAINQEHALCEAGYRTALEHAYRIGDLLAQAREQVPHGEWLAWVTEHTSLSDRRARAYMQLAGDANRPSTADLTIEDALRVIAKPAPKPPAADLRTAFADVDQADAQAALAELGPMRRESTFPSSPAERARWRQIGESLGRMKRAMDESTTDGLSKWSRQEALHEAARHARSVASQLNLLADSLGA